MLKLDLDADNSLLQTWDADNIQAITRLHAIALSNGQISPQLERNTVFGTNLEISKCSETVGIDILIPALHGNATDTKSMVSISLQKGISNIQSYAIRLHNQSTEFIRE